MLRSYHRGNIKYLLSLLLSPPLFQEKRYQSGEWVPPTWTWIVFCRWLRPVHRQLGEGSEEFALRVQQVVGDTGRVEVGSFFGRRRRTLEKLRILQFSLAVGQRIGPDRDTTHSSRQSRAHEATETPQIAPSVRCVVSGHTAFQLFFNQF